MAKCRYCENELDRGSPVCPYCQRSIYGVPGEPVQDEGEFDSLLPPDMAKVGNDAPQLAVPFFVRISVNFLLAANNIAQAETAVQNGTGCNPDEAKRWVAEQRRAMLAGQAGNAKNAGCQTATSVLLLAAALPGVVAYWCW